MNSTLRAALLLAASTLVNLPLPASAHRGWMLPSATVVSGKDVWITVDAAVSNDLFYFEHNPLRIDNVAVVNPDGTAGKVENSSKGRFRSTFDLQLTQSGTYKVELVNDALMASYRDGKDIKRLRGTAESLAKEIPAGAQELRVTHAQSRMEFFVTSGKPTTKNLAPKGQGLELVPITHPTDLVSGETAKFRFLLDGKPAAGISVVVIPGGIRYRDKLEDMKLMTDAEGVVSIKWAHPGMYWLNATPEAPREQAPAGQAVSGPGAGPRFSSPAGTLDKPVRRSSYTATLEVLAQ